MLPAPRMHSRAVLHDVRIVRRSQAEQRGADPHHGRAFLDRGLEVAAHAHRQRVEPGAARVELSQQRAQLREPGALARRLALLGRHAHQAAQLRGAAARATAAASAGSSAGVTPPLLASPPRFTCRQTFSGGAWYGPLRRRGARRSSAGRRACTQANCSATGRVLLACSRPMKCQVSAQLAAAPQSSPAPPAGSSRRSRATPSVGRAWQALRRGWALLTARSVTESTLRPARRGGPCRCVRALQRGAPANSADPLTYWTCNPSVILPAPLESAALARRSCPLLRRRSRELQWPSISRNSWRSPSRTRPPTCTCPPACRR